MPDIFPGATLIQITQWGYPRGVKRPPPNPALTLSTIHITATTSTAVQLATYWRNNPSVEIGSTFIVDRDGSVIQCLADPLGMDPWTNGALNRPNLANPRIAAVVRDRVNPNERSLLTIENVGREPSAPITAAQEATNGRIIAYYHNMLTVPISRHTVVGHYEWDSVNRPNCPSTDKSVLDRIVKLAQEDEVPPPGTRNAGAPIGTFTWTGTGHLLISPSDTSVRFSQSANPGPFAVIASLDLKDPKTGAPVDIDGKSPPVGGRDQVYLVEAPTFGAAAYVLRQDGIFSPVAIVAEAEKAGAEGAALAAKSYADSLP